MKKLVLTTVMLFLSTFLFDTENVYAHGYVEPTWVEDINSGIVCTIDGAYSYGVLVVEESENGKEVAMIPAGTNIMQAIIVRSAIVKKLLNHYDGNGVFTLDIRVSSRYSSCDIETRRIKFVQQKTGH